MDKTCVCVGLLSQYIIVDYDTGHIQDLFPYDNEKTKPIVTRISKVSIDNFCYCKVFIGVMTGAIVLKETKTSCQKWNILIVPILFFSGRISSKCPKCFRNVCHIQRHIPETAATVE